MQIIEKNHDVAVYGGYLENDDKLMQSASGGMATALAEKTIAQGGYVAGVCYSDDFYQAEYIVTNQMEDIKKLKGSKYTEVDKKDVYKQVKALLNQGESVLFIGLPCTVAAMYSFLGCRHENLLTCELICHGPTSQKVHREYIGYLEDKFKSKIIDFSVRHQHFSRTRALLYVKFESGQEYTQPFYNTEYGYAFSIYGRPACYHCKFKGNNRQGDIMVGDFWGATKADPFWNRKGCSVIFAETEKGHETILSLDDIKLFPTSFERAVVKNSSVIRAKRKHNKYEKFASLFQKKGLIYAAKYTPDILHRIKYVLVRFKNR